MKNTLFMVAVVAAYSLIEAGALLGILVLPVRDWDRRRHLETLAICVQLFAIPGLAALLSRVIYGSGKWLHRMLLIVLLGVLLPPALLLLVVIIGAPLAWAFSISKALFAVMLTVLVGGAGLAVVWVVRKGIRRGIRLAARKWTTDRELGVTTAERKWRGRGLRIAVCIPLITVLLVFLFLPETWGLFSHLVRPSAGRLVGYRVSIPPTWVIQFARESDNGESSARGLAGRGWAFGGEPYVHSELSLGSWSVWTEPFHQTDPSPYSVFIDRDREITATRAFGIADEQLTCEEYVPGWLKRAHFAGDANRVFITCKSAGRLRAALGGERIFVPEFYKMIGGIQKTR